MWGSAMKDEPDGLSLEASNVRNRLRRSQVGGKATPAIPHEDRLNKIIEFWFRPGDDLDSTA